MDDMRFRAGGERKQVVIAFKRALYAFQSEHGELPYDPRGGAAALYKLRPFIDSKRLTDLGFAGRFDVDGETLADCPLEYLNEPGIKLGDVAPELIILAERRKDGAGGRWVCRADGSVSFIDSEKHVLRQQHSEP